MPVTFDFICENESCTAENRRFESLLPHWDSPNPQCPYCGAGLRRLPAAPKSIWMKSWDQYGLRGTGEEDLKQNVNTIRSGEGVVAYRRKTTRHLDGTPEKVMIRTHADMKTFCKDEGLMSPDDLNSNSQISKDGKVLSTSGMPSQWV